MLSTYRGIQHATPTEVTLLDLVWAVGQYTTSEVEIVATVASLVNTG